MVAYSLLFCNYANVTTHKNCEIDGVVSNGHYQQDGEITGPSHSQERESHGVVIKLMNLD